jgi:predicted metal-dependent enzyme (double-stranded beta helix superfamily)
VGSGKKEERGMGEVGYTIDEFAYDMRHLLAAEPRQEELFDRGSAFLERLLRYPEAIPEQFLRPATNGRRRGGGSYVLHRSPGLLVTSVIWGPGSHIGPHDHHTWGMIGVLNNGIQETRFERVDDHRSAGWAKLVKDRTYAMRSGQISLLVPESDEIHQLDNFSDRPTVEIHVYGAELGELERCQYNLETGEVKVYRSGKFDNC